MVAVTKEKFYSVIGPLDVTLSVRGSYPYTTGKKNFPGLQRTQRKRDLRRRRRNYEDKRP